MGVRAHCICGGTAAAASCRAVLFGLLWPDPCDPLCPGAFNPKAREMPPRVQGKVGPADEDLRDPDTILKNKIVEFVRVAAARALNHKQGEADDELAPGVPRRRLVEPVRQGAAARALHGADQGGPAHAPRYARWTRGSARRTSCAPSRATRPVSRT